MKTKIKLILFAGLVALLASCATQRRCSRKFPPVIERETIVKDSTIITERTKFDTIFGPGSKDTVFLYDHETRIKIKYLTLPGDSVFVEAECPEDTITVRTHTITNKVIHEDKNGPGGWFWVLILFGAVGLLFGVSYVIKQLKR